MAADDEMKLFFDYRYLVYEIVNGFNPNKYNIEELTDTGICSLLREVQEHENANGIDFESRAIFSIKSEINMRIQNED